MLPGWRAVPGTNYGRYINPAGQEVSRRQYQIAATGTTPEKAAELHARARVEANPALQRVVKKWAEANNVTVRQALKDDKLRKQLTRQHHKPRTEAQRTERDEFWDPYKDELTH